MVGPAPAAEPTALLALQEVNWRLKVQAACMDGHQAAQHRPASLAPAQAPAVWTSKFPLGMSIYQVAQEGTLLTKGCKVLLSTAACVLPKLLWGDGREMCVFPREKAGWVVRAEINIVDTPERQELQICKGKVIE